MAPRVDVHHHVHLAIFRRVAPELEHRHLRVEVRRQLRRPLGVTGVGARELDARATVGRLARDEE